MVPAPTWKDITGPLLVLLFAASASLAVSTSKHHDNPAKLPPPPPHGGSHSDSQIIRDQWSSVIGWISIACWILPAFSQLRENYVRKSGEGLSLAFLFIWFAGDFLNLVGAWRQELLWTMIVLALYYTACDVALIGQYYYYKKYHDYFEQQKEAARNEQSQSSSSQEGTHTATESTPLISGNNINDRNKAPNSRHPSSQSKLKAFREDVLPYLLAVGFVVGTGVAAWLVEQYNARHPPQGPISPPIDDGEGPGWKWDAQISGWLSAALYLCSRVPQIFKNRQTKCEGLSLALFLFAVAGNTTYIASIMIKSMDRGYLIRNMSWLVGSIGTVGLDFIVLGQFVHYRREREQMEAASERESSVSASASETA